MRTPTFTLTGGNLAAFSEWPPDRAAGDLGVIPDGSPLIVECAVGPADGSPCDLIVKALVGESVWYSLAPLVRCRPIKETV